MSCARSKADQAAQLAKADLLTDMVGEFPELQGIMGGYYARHDGLRDGVAIAIEDHYKPRFAGDALPRNHAGTVLALADKLETLVGLFGIGQLPTGDKDPFALRRHALGVIRMLVERTCRWSLPALLAAAFAAFGCGHEAGPTCCTSCTTAWRATCASRATAPRRSTPWWRCARRAGARSPSGWPRCVPLPRCPRPPRWPRPTSASATS
jgi:glycyl-tRNA synthetase beta subunit